MPWEAIVRSPIMVDVLDAELGRIIEVKVPSIKVRRYSGDEPWLDELCRAAFRSKKAAYHRWWSVRTPARRVLFRESQRESHACHANTRAS